MDAEYIKAENRKAHEEHERYANTNGPVTAPMTGEREVERLVARGGATLYIEGEDDSYDLCDGQKITLVRARDFDALRADRARVTAEREKLRRGWLSDIARINEALSWTAEEYAENVSTQYDGDDVACYVDHIGWLTREYDGNADALASAQREAAGLHGLVEAAKAWAELRRDPENQEHTIVVWAEADRRLLENVNALTPAPEAGR